MTFYSAWYEQASASQEKALVKYLLADCSAQTHKRKSKWLFKGVGNNLNNTLSVGLPPGEEVKASPRQPTHATLFPEMDSLIFLMQFPYK